MSLGESYYRYETADGCLIITLLPELNDKQWADIEKVGTEIVDRLSNVQSPRFIVDLSQLSYMGSAMVALIVRLYKSVNGRGGQMVVVNQHELVFEVLKLAGLTKLWTIVDSREQAFATLGVKRRAVAADGGPVAQGGNAILVAGIIGVAGALIGMALQFSPHAGVPRKFALLIEVAFAALGMVAGTMMLVNQTGGRRNVGIVLLAICLLVVLGGIVAGPDQSTAPVPAPAGTSATAPANVVSSTTTVSTTSPPAATVPASAPAAGNAPAPTAAAAQNPSTAQPSPRKRKDK